jgi:hypothetical protein
MAWLSASELVERIEVDDLIEFRAAGFRFFPTKVGVLEKGEFDQADLPRIKENPLLEMGPSRPDNRQTLP